MARSAAAKPSVACKASSEKADYGNLLSVPQEVQTAIESYRGHWRNLCKGSNKQNVTLAGLLEEAEDIESKFTDVYESEHQSHGSMDAGESGRANAIHDLVATAYPRFVPAFEGSYMEYEYFRPSLQQFKDNIAMGNAEDRLFLASKIVGDRTFDPWIQATWDYGGCENYGTYDWIAALREVVRLKRQLKSEFYLKKVSTFENRMLGNPGPVSSDLKDYNVCTCNEKAAVLRDLVVINEYIKQTPELAIHVPTVQWKIDQIQSGKATIKSEKERHCSGG
jgi:hypothetical protein